MISSLSLIMQIAADRAAAICDVNRVRATAAAAAGSRNRLMDIYMRNTKSGRRSRGRCKRAHQHCLWPASRRIIILSALLLAGAFCTRVSESTAEGAISQAKSSIASEHTSDTCTNCLANKLADSKDAAAGKSSALN